MNRSIPHRSRSRLAGLAALAVAAGALTPLTVGSASAGTATPPPAPSLLGPLSSGPVVKDVVLDWRSVPDADSYVVELGTDEDWSDDAVHEEKTVASEVAMPSWLPHASYLWRVAAVNDGVQGAWSRNGTFTRGWRARPELVSPAVGATVSGRPTFSWTPVPGASAYQLQVSTSSTFTGGSALDADPARDQASPTVDTCYTTRTEVTPFTEKVSAREDNAGPCVFSVLGSGETVYWRVRPVDRYVDTAEEIATSPASSAGISYLPPNASSTELVSDCPGSTPVPVPTPSASASPSPAASPGATPAPSASATPSPSASPTRPPTAGEGDTSGCAPTHPVDLGRWSAFRALTTTYAAPTTTPASSLGIVPMSALPSYCGTAAGGSPVCDDFPTLRWQAVAGAHRYRVYIALNDDYTNVQRIVETSALSWTPTDAWRESSVAESYHYVVQACSLAGCGRVPGAAVLQSQTFRKKSPPARTATAKLPQSTVDGVELRWEDYGQTRRTSGGRTETAGAYAYRVEVRSGGASFAQGAPVEMVTVDGSRCRPDATPVSGFREDSSLDCDDSATAAPSAAGDVISYVSKEKAYPSTPGALLHWRVQAVDPSGNRLPWSAPQSFDPTGPVLTVTPMTGLAADQTLTVTFSARVTGVTSGTLRLRSTPSTVTPVGDGRTFKVKANSLMYAGATYVLEASPAIRDVAGNAHSPRPVTLRTNAQVDDRSAGLRLTGAWTRLSASGAVGGSYVRGLPSAGRPATTSTAVFGKGVELKGCVGPGNGVLEVWADGARLARVDTYRAATGCGVVLSKVTFPKGSGLHTVELRGTGQKNAAAKGAAVSVDALTAMP